MPAGVIDDQGQIYPNLIQILTNDQHKIKRVIVSKDDYQRLIKQDIDDRGFVSRTTYFVNGEKTAVDYLTPSGEVAMHVSLPDQVVTTKETWFGAKKFANTTVLFQAILKQKLSKISDEAPLIVTQTDVINQFLLENDIQHDIIYSAQERRETSKMTLPQCVKAVVTDNKESLKKPPILISIGWLIKRLHNNWLSFLSSSRYYGTTNMRASLSTPPVALSQAVTNLIETSDQSTDIDDELLDNNGLSDELKMAGNQPVTIKTVAERFIINIAPTEEKQQRAIEKVRVLVDLNTQPNAYLQTLALSALIPQINAVKTPIRVGKSKWFHY
ncbi:hypothetical protein Pfo_031591 [Paulownia fortunei]|nr:hypothetical protein Pfo_031591 [Paulownia fortunei]